MKRFAETMHRLWIGIGQSLLAIVLSTAVVLLVAGLMGRDPFALLTVLFTGAIGDGYRFADALGRSCPLILCGLAVAIAFKCQVWNIGVEGQYLLGAIVATIIGVGLPGVSSWLLIPLIVVGAMLAGMLYGLVPIWLENHRNVPLVLSTILLNFVAISLVSYLTQGPLRGSDPSAAQSNPIVKQAELPLIVSATDLHAGFLLAIIGAVVLFLLMERTTLGFTVRAVGLNPSAASWCGIGVNSTRVWVMMVSGALGGLAGGLQVIGVTHVLNIQASEEFGYVGIAVALLGRLHPLGVAVAGILLGMLDVAAAHMERQPDLGVPADLAEVIKGVLVLSVLVFAAASRWPMLGRFTKSDEKCGTGASPA
jgi:simple sugar transport system permease protein